MKNQFRDLLHSHVDNIVRKEAEERGQLNLGMLKAELDKCHSDKPVVFDIGGFPSKPHSYRGYYNQLSLEPTEEMVKVSKVQSLLDESTGKTYTGYKGGDYTMNNYTMVWCSPYGTALGAAIIGVDEQEYKVVIITKNTYEEEI